ncbi:MAG: alpha-E domain-containing protein [Gammaproteobacteria bacterium]|nr:alpha-E domain-containing protein [Gammaproteobacteria bacterium]
MLSRAAERIYWAGRYLERAENTARIVQQYSQLLLDLPGEVGVKWDELVAIFGAARTFEHTGEAGGEHQILDFMLADANSGTSLLFSIKMARDNIRNSRDLLPQESWESVNELYQYARQMLGTTTSNEDRFDVLSECIGRCQQINGILMGTMSHNSPYRFLLIGQSIERADMMSRVIDVAAAYLQQNERLVLRYGSTLWTNVLKSVSGFQMYRQYCQPQVEGLVVIDFLLNDRMFPRAVRACVERAKQTATSLPSGDHLIHALDRVENALPSPLPDSLDGAEVSRLMDALQKRLGDAHNAVVETWFLPGDDV